MSDSRQKHTRGVPWADHTEPSSSGAANPADRSARVDPEELEEEHVSPGSLAASTPATPDDAEHEPPDERVEGEGPPKRDVGKGSLRFDHLSEEHKVD